MKSGNDSKTTQTATSEPWAAAQPNLKTVMSGAADLYKSGNLFKPYTESTVVPFSPVSQNAMDWSGQQALASLPGLQQNFASIAGMANGSGLNNYQTGALEQMQRTARGDYLDPNTNPGFANVLQQAQNAARDSVTASAAASGRYGSGIAQGNLAREVGNVTGNLTYQNYAQERARQDAAQGAVFNGGQQGQANRFAASQMLPGAYQATLSPFQTLAGIGAQQEDLASRQMNDRLRIWDEQNSQSQQALGWLNAISSGAGQLGSTQRQSVPSPSPFSAGLGGAAAGFQMGGPMGALIGGGAGLLGGFL